MVGAGAGTTHRLRAALLLISYRVAACDLPAHGQNRKVNKRMPLSLQLQFRAIAAQKVVRHRAHS